MDGVSGVLSHFFVEPMVPHADEQEHYASLYSHRSADVIMFHHEGGVDVGDVDAKVRARCCSLARPGVVLHRCLFFSSPSLTYQFPPPLAFSFCFGVLGCGQALTLEVPVSEEPNHDDLLNLVRNAPEASRTQLAKFLAGLLRMYRDLHFCLLEINPLVFKDGAVLPLDVAAKVGVFFVVVGIFVLKGWSCHVC